MALHPIETGLMRLSFFNVFLFWVLISFGPGKSFAQIESRDPDIGFYEPSDEVKATFLKDLLKSKKQNKQDSVRQIPELNLGGALRLNYAYKDYDDLNKDRLGDFGFEMFRIDADITYKDIFFLVEFRWYSDFNAIRRGYFGYHVTDNTSFQIGIHQVPFGMLPYSSHSFWFNATYYLGFEDDYDAGIKLIHDNEKWNLQAAFYKNPEYTDSERFGRYSFDLVTDEVQTNEEINQFNLRAIYKWQLNDNFLIKLGASAETGQIYNKTTEKKGNRHAVALHNNMFYKKWNFQLQWINYEFNPENPDGLSDKTVQFGAFTFPFLVSSKANIYSMNVAKQIDINGNYLDTIKLYLNTSMVEPKIDFGSTSKQIVIGTTLIKRGLYAYFDYIFGQNMWFSGGPGIGLSHPEDQNWNSRLNINLGYYF